MIDCAGRHIRPESSHRITRFINTEDCYHYRGATSDVSDLTWSDDSKMLAFLSCDKSLNVYKIGDTIEKLDTVVQTRNRVDIFKQFPNGVAIDPRGQSNASLMCSSTLHLQAVI